MSALFSSTAMRLLAVLVALTLIRIWLPAAAQLDLNEEEAQYWVWSTMPDWSYYSKGPLVAWLIHLSTSAFGHGEWQVRLFAWLAFNLFVIGMYCLARDLWQSRRAGWWAVLLAVSTPIYFALGEVMTTDVLLFAAWVWCLWALQRALIEDRPGYWYLAAVLAGLGALAKTSMLLLPFFAGLVILADRRLRPRLWRPQPWLAMLSGTVLLLPIIFWNARHDWVMLRHEQGHFGGVDPDPLRTLQLLLEQWLLYSPIIATLLLIQLWRPPGSRQRWIWRTSLLILGFFLFKSLFDKVQPNWPAPAFIGLLAIFAGSIPAFSSARRRWLWAGIGLSALILAVVLFPHYLRIPVETRPDMRGWRDAFTTMAAQTPPVDFVLATRYQSASELKFYWPGPVRVYVIGDADRRMTQFDLWPGPEQETGTRAMLFTTENRLHPTARTAFDTCRALPSVPVNLWNGETRYRYFSWYCEGYTPTRWPGPAHY